MPTAKGAWPVHWESHPIPTCRENASGDSQSDSNNPLLRPFAVHKVGLLPGPRVASCSEIESEVARGGGRRIEKAKKLKQELGEKKHKITENPK